MGGGGKIYAIGDIGPSGVGIVFYVTDGGLHGLEVAPSLWKGGGSDPIAKWKDTNNSTPGTFTAIGTGYANTTAMAGTTHPAAELCRTYTGGGKTDWFLPSRDELDALFNNLVDDGAGNNNGFGGFAYDYYWSSSEYGAMYAWYTHFNGGSSDGNIKGNMLYVRAVRAF